MTDDGKMMLDSEIIKGSFIALDRISDYIDTFRMTAHQEQLCTAGILIKAISTYILSAAGSRNTFDMRRKEEFARQLCARFQKAIAETLEIDIKNGCMDFKVEEGNGQ